MAASPSARRQPVEAGEDREGLADAQAVGEGQVAGDEADLLHGLRAARGRRWPSDVDRAAVGRDDAEQHQQRRRLAGAVGAEEGDPLAGADREVDAVDGDDVAEPLRRGRAPPAPSPPLHGRTLRTARRLGLRLSFRRTPLLPFSAIPRPRRIGGAPSGSSRGQAERSSRSCTPSRDRRSAPWPRAPIETREGPHGTGARPLEAGAEGPRRAGHDRRGHGRQGHVAGQEGRPRRPDPHAGRRRRRRRPERPVERRRRDRPTPARRCPSPRSPSRPTPPARTPPAEWELDATAGDDARRAAAAAQRDAGAQPGQQGDRGGSGQRRERRRASTARASRARASRATGDDDGEPGNRRRRRRGAVTATATATASRCPAGRARASTARAASRARATSRRTSRASRAASPRSSTASPSRSRAARPARRGLRLPAGQGLPAVEGRRVRVGEAGPPVRPAQGRPHQGRQPARRSQREEPGAAAHRRGQRQGPRAGPQPPPVRGPHAAVPRREAQDGARRRPDQHDGPDHRPDLADREGPARPHRVAARRRARPRS